VVERFNREPLTVGPRWFCPCLANHWQIEWYEHAVPTADFWGVPIGGRIEVVMGAQLGEDDLPRIYGYDPALGFIAEKALPAFLSALPPSEVRSGVEVRRWVGVRILESMGSDPKLSGPAFLLVRHSRVPPRPAWDRFLASDAVREQGVVAFKEKPHRDGVVQAFLVPTGRLSGILNSMRTCFGIESADVRVFRLGSFQG
ncbi:MAG: hypothetical protein ACREDF_07075, partial [Thermoplasmata archaeon]